MSFYVFVKRNTCLATLADAVRPGDSIPNKLINPGVPWSEGPCTRKSGCGSPGPCILGRIPEYAGTRAPS